MWFEGWQSGRLGARPVGHRRYLVTVTVCIVAVLGSGPRQLGFNDNIRAWFDPDEPRLAAPQRSDNAFK